jgi:hypothetical protein
MPSLATGMSQAKRGVVGETKAGWALLQNKSWLSRCVLCHLPVLAFIAGQGALVVSEQSVFLTRVPAAMGVRQPFHCCWEDKGGHCSCPPASECMHEAAARWDWDCPVLARQGAKGAAGSAIAQGKTGVGQLKPGDSRSNGATADGTAHDGDAGASEPVPPPQQQQPLEKEVAVEVEVLPPGALSPRSAASALAAAAEASARASNLQVVCGCLVKCIDGWMVGRNLDVSVNGM